MRLKQAKNLRDDLDSLIRSLEADTEQPEGSQ
jgi:hypothetical protein